MPSTGGNASSPVSQWASVFTDADIGTPFQIAIPDGAVSYLYKRALGSSTWKKMSAAHAIDTGAAASNLVSQAFSALVTVPCNAPQATINVKALSATSVRIANIIVVKIA